MIRFKFKVETVPFTSQPRKDTKNACKCSYTQVCVSPLVMPRTALNLNASVVLSHCFFTTNEFSLFSPDRSQSRCVQRLRNDAADSGIAPRQRQMRRNTVEYRLSDEWSHDDVDVPAVQHWYLHLECLQRWHVEITPGMSLLLLTLDCLPVSAETVKAIWSVKAASVRYISERRTFASSDFLFSQVATPYVQDIGSVRLNQLYESHIKSGQHSELVGVIHSLPQ